MKQHQLLWSEPQKVDTDLPQGSENKRPLNICYPLPSGRIPLSEAWAHSCPDLCPIFVPTAQHMQIPCKKSVYPFRIIVVPWYLWGIAPLIPKSVEVQAPLCKGYRICIQTMHILLYSLSHLSLHCL